jgi:hypothetical protein
MRTGAGRAIEFAELPSQHATLEERRISRRRERRWFGGLAEVTEVALDARGGSDERTQPHASTAAITFSARQE